MDDYRSRIKWTNNPAILCALKSCVVFSDLFLLFERKKLSRKKILGNFSFCYHYHFICSILYTFTYIVYVDIFCVSSYMYNVYLCENSSNFYLFFYRWHFNREEFQGKFYSAPYTYCMELLVYIVKNQPRIALIILLGLVIKTIILYEYWIIMAIAGIFVCWKWSGSPIFWLNRLTSAL